MTGTKIYRQTGQLRFIARKALLKGKEILVFPTGLDLETKNILLTESPWEPDKPLSRLACSYTSNVGFEQVTHERVTVEL
jgi:hypothetical protein